MRLVNGLNSKGDTIIEVLIAIAVISSVLGIAYSIMNINVATIRDNQERTEASKLAQGQLEILKSTWEENPDALATAAASSFCLSTAGELVSNPDEDQEDLELGYDQRCTYYSGDVVDDNGFFHVDVRRTDATTLTYLVTVRWDKLGGGRSQIVMAYRLR